MAPDRSQETCGKKIELKDFLTVGPGSMHNQKESS